ncbi:MAG TPA: TIGR02677 family protein [Ktedonobacteraceae bacterium]|nr:TIGR02677 family protein [Ktedonobacteraceae bacterium]
MNEQESHDMYEANSQISNTIENFEEDVIPRSSSNLNTGITPASEPFSTLSIFNVTDRLPIFSYLVSSNRIRWYRVIMRFFLQCHRELYRYQLTAQEVRDTVRATFDTEYTLDQCQNDLAALKDWGNVTTIYDSSRATSITSFLSPALLYQATPEAIAIETFLDEQNRASTGKGSLRQGDLPHLWKSLQALDEDLASLSLEPSPTHSREMAEEWQRAFEIWNTMAREAAQYLANMLQAAQQSRPDFEAYQSYKAAVVAYVHGFAQALTQYSRRIRTLLTAWSETGKKDRLIEIIAQHLEPPAPTLENRSSQDELLQEASNQVEALMNWFALGKNADSFRRNALAEVDKVVRRASTLAASTRPNANYAANLHVLAQQLLKAKDGETAQQLFSLAFANMLPVHLPESLAGAASATYDAREGSAWQVPPTVSLRLRPISRAYRGEHPLEDPVIDNRTIIRNLVHQYEEKRQQELQRFAQLFSTAYLDFGVLRHITIEDRDVLLTIIDGCLGDSHRQYRAPDGSVIVLLNPDEQTYTALRASDGMLLLPRYRLQREELQGGAA